MFVNGNVFPLAGDSVFVSEPGCSLLLVERQLQIWMKTIDFKSPEVRVGVESSP